MVISTLMLMVFLIAIATSVFAAGIQLPDRIGKVDPRTVAQTPPFNEPGVRELAPGQYEVYMLAQIWSFTPREIRVPAGSTVTLYATSKDVIHGFLLEGTDINIMLIPGQVSQATFRLEKPGEYRFICHEYCGIGHQGMTGKIIVE
jgi:cytochrome c oxidase subunit 2